MYYFFAILIALVAFVNVVVHSKAKAAEKPPAQGYYDQQLLNYRYTDLCALGKVPKELIAAAQKFHAANPEAPDPVGEWIMGVVREQATAKCEDA